MSEFIGKSFFVLGALCLVVGIYQAIAIWPDLPEGECTAETIVCVSADEERELAEAMAPAQKEVAIYWAASGLVSCMFLWGFAAIIGELTKIRKRAGGSGAGPN